MAHLSLFQLNALIKNTLERNLESTYWVIAEIGELRLNPKGHCYLELVEKEGQFISAKIKATIWSYTYRNLSGWFESVTKTRLQAGLKVLLQVSIQFHEVYGLSLNVKDLDPNYTLGERAKKRQLVIQELKNQGLFDLNKSLKLPFVPQRIAVISSATAAGYGDFKEQLTGNQRNFHFHYQLFPAAMQGTQATASIIEALNKIKDVRDQFDLVVIIRGGGAQLDLDCFDEYQLSAEVARFPLPVITGIGHERDETITDLVAHTATKTPTAVAEFLINGLEVFDDQLNELAIRLSTSTNNRIVAARLSLTEVLSNFLLQAKNRSFLAASTLQSKQQRLENGTRSLLAKSTEQLSKLTEQFRSGANLQLQSKISHLNLLEKTTNLLDPEATLKRGYSISRIDGKLLKNVQVKSGDILETVTEDQTIFSKIESSSDHA